MYKWRKADLKSVLEPGQKSYDVKEWFTKYFYEIKIATSFTWFLHLACEENKCLMDMFM